MAILCSGIWLGNLGRSPWSDLIRSLSVSSFLTHGLRAEFSEEESFLVIGEFISHHLFLFGVLIWDSEEAGHSITCWVGFYTQCNYEPSGLGPQVSGFPSGLILRCLSSSQFCVVAAASESGRHRCLEICCSKDVLFCLIWASFLSEHGAKHSLSSFWFPVRFLDRVWQPLVCCDVCLYC